MPSVERVGISSRLAVKSDVEIAEGVPGMLAVLGEGGSVQRASGAFIERFEVRHGSLSSAPAELELITSGQADQLTAQIDGLEADLLAVLDGDGRRLAVLTIARAQDEDGDEQPSPLLEEPLDESPAIIWLKDLDGRYLRVNRRYEKQLDTTAEQVCGRTDAELTAAGSMEGMRLEEEDVAGREPLELEYLIGAFEERPAFAALRFALRDSDGQPTATCSVAAPISRPTWPARSASG